MEYMTAKETGIRWHLCTRRVLVLCLQNRISGTIRMGYQWLIPKTAEKPDDLRKTRIHKLPL